MSGRSRLEWVQHNRTRQRHIHRVGPTIRRVAERLIEDGSAVSSKVATALAGMVDEKFRTHCRIGGIRGGTVVINVDHPVLASVMRLQWSSSLGKMIRGRRWERSISRVVFEFGDAGVRIPEPREC